MNPIRLPLLVGSAIVLALLNGCATGGAARQPHVALAALYPTTGNQVRGTVTFTKVRGGMRVVADLTGLTPGDHGFHVHEKGDCSAPDATSAGGHFNPTKMDHCGPDCVARHVGDLGNITADATGHGRYDRVDKELTFAGDKSILGRSVIVHAKADDLKSQPTGGAGARVACGVIKSP